MLKVDIDELVKELLFTLHKEELLKIEEIDVSATTQQMIEIFQWRN